MSYYSPQTRARIAARKRKARFKSLGINTLQYGAIGILGALAIAAAIGLFVGIVWFLGVGLYDNIVAIYFDWRIVPFNVILALTILGLVALSIIRGTLWVLHR